MALWPLLLLAVPPARAQSNELWRWVSEYRAQLPANRGDQYTANWRRDLEPILRKFDDNPQTFPVTLVAQRFADQAVAAVGRSCRAGAPEDADAVRRFQLRTECLWHALVQGYDRSAAAKAISVPRPPDITQPTSDDVELTAASVLEAAEAYRRLDGGSINYVDPGGNDEGLWDRIVMTGNGQFAPSDKIYELTRNIRVDLGDRGRADFDESGCNAQLTLAEVFYSALRVAEGSLPVAAGAISGMLFNNRKWADCIVGLRRSQNEYKDYYRFAGLYIGFQEGVVKRKASSALAQAQTGVYGAIRQAQYTFTGRPMAGTERAGFITKFPELYVGLDAADKVRGGGSSSGATRL